MSNVKTLKQAVLHVLHTHAFMNKHTAHKHKYNFKLGSIINYGNAVFSFLFFFFKIYENARKHLQMEKLCLIKAFSQFYPAV